MRKIFTSLLFIVLMQTGFSQKVQYAYDNNGNRIQRKLVVTGPNQKMANSTTEEEEKSKTIAIEEGISVYPNPAKDKVVLSINDFNPSETNSMSLLDVKGNIIISQKITSGRSEMDVSMLVSGIYYFNVVKNKNMLYYKLVKVD
ncbi:MAG: T9SS type A sorting domain-containing protein [Bacteroidota bacterium]